MQQSGWLRPLLAPRSIVHSACPRPEAVPGWLQRRKPFRRSSGRPRRSLGSRSSSSASLYQRALPTTPTPPRPFSVATPLLRSLAVSAFAGGISSIGLGAWWLLDDGHNDDQPVTTGRAVVLPPVLPWWPWLVVTSAPCPYLPILPKPSTRRPRTRARRSARGSPKPPRIGCGLTPVGGVWRRGRRSTARSPPRNSPRGSHGRAPLSGDARAAPAGARPDGRGHLRHRRTGGRRAQRPGHVGAPCRVPRRGGRPNRPSAGARRGLARRRPPSQPVPAARDVRGRAHERGPGPPSRGARRQVRTRRHRRSPSSKARPAAAMPS